MNFGGGSGNNPPWARQSGMYIYMLKPATILLYYSNGISEGFVCLLCQNVQCNIICPCMQHYYTGLPPPLRCKS